MSKLHLTQSQRSAVLVGAALVAALLILQICVVGMEHTPWLVGAIVVVALAVIGLSPDKPIAQSDGGAIAPTAPAAPPVVRPPVTAEAPLARPVPLTPVRKRAAEVHKFEPAISAMAAEYTKFVIANASPTESEDKWAAQKQQSAALKIAFMMLALAIERNRHGFVSTEGFQVLKDIFLKQLTEHLEKADAEFHDPSDTRRKAIADLVNSEEAACEIAIHESIGSYAECAHYPLDPIVTRINREVPLAFGAHRNPIATTPEQRDGVYHAALKTLYDTATSVMFGAVS